MDEERLKAVLESLLFAAGEPLSIARLAAVLDNVPKEAIRKALGELAADFHRQGRGILLAEVAGGFQLRTAQEHALYVRKLLAARPPRLSRPMLETMAIIAYRQPITRPEIEQLRGVDSGAVLETLLERRLVKIAGRKEAPGRPQMYVTTPEFLETFGLKDLESLPNLGELREIEQRIEAAEQQRIAGEAQSQQELELAASSEPAEAQGERMPDEPPVPGEQPADGGETSAAQTVAEDLGEAPPIEKYEAPAPEQQAGDQRALEEPVIAAEPSEEPARPGENAASERSDDPADAEPGSDD